jgi:K+-transporting ATPase ATPase A chain
MTGNGIFQLALYLVALIGLAWPLGLYMARVYRDEPPAFVRWLKPVENGLYRLCGVKPGDDMPWTRYAFAMLAFNLLGFLAVYALQRFQVWLPLNPEGLANTTADSAFNTAVSFATNTNWQGYGGETTMSYLTQMLGLNVQNFLSAASGMAVVVALMRGFTRKEASGVGNFWVDMLRSTLYVLLPLSLILSLALVGQGVVQTFSPYAKAELVQPYEYEQAKNGSDGKPVLDAQGQPVMEKGDLSATQQTIAVGPAASQIAIKQLGTNGGGFFNVNSAHPLENPTPLSNFLELLAILLIPAALCFTFGRWSATCARAAPPGRHDRGVRRPAGGVRRPSSRQPAVRPPGPRHPGLRAARRPAATWKARRPASASSTPRSGPPPPPPPPTAR